MPGVPQGDYSVDLNPQPSDYRASTLPTVLSVSYTVVTFLDGPEASATATIIHTAHAGQVKAILCTCLELKYKK